MEMAFIATSNRSGECDCSFQAGPAGFVQVLDEPGKRLKVEAVHTCRVPGQDLAKIIFGPVVKIWRSDSVV